MLVVGTQLSVCPANRSLDSVHAPALFERSDQLVCHYCHCITRAEIMPTRKVKGGFRWGRTGKVYPTREQAERQGRAVEARRGADKPKRKKR